MFISGGLSILLAVLFTLLVAISVFSRKLNGFSHLSGDIRCEGRRTRACAPPASMLLLSTVLSLGVFLLGAIF
jgi:hypothetical protein